jgi:hypothetical protein
MLLTKFLAPHRVVVRPVGDRDRDPVRHHDEPDADMPGDRRFVVPTLAEAELPVRNDAFDRAAKVLVHLRPGEVAPSPFPRIHSGPGATTGGGDPGPSSHRTPPCGSAVRPLPPAGSGPGRCQRPSGGKPPEDWSWPPFSDPIVERHSGVERLRLVRRSGEADGPSDGSVSLYQRLPPPVLAPVPRPTSRGWAQGAPVVR